MTSLPRALLDADGLVNDLAATLERHGIALDPDLAARLERWAVERAEPVAEAMRETYSDAEGDRL